MGCTPTWDKQTIPIERNSQQRELAKLEFINETGNGSKQVTSVGQSRSGASCD